MSSLLTPLLDRPVTDVIALDPRRQYTVAEFMGQVHQLAENLPPVGYAINLCADRYRFLVGFCAALVRGQCNLLLPNHRVRTQHWARERYADCLVLHDGIEVLESCPARDLCELPRGASSSDIPEIDLDHLCALAFTSGSTGESTAVPRNWRTIWEATAINRSAYLERIDRDWQLLATVPAQHMYGLETSIFLPLRAPVSIHPGRPLYPIDVARDLAELSEPRVLVTTPIHMRALLASDIEFPPVALILSATAPLQADMAAAMEQRFQGVVREIYGCSEAGSLAFRHTAREDHWQLFDAFDAEEDSQGNTEVRAAHLPEPIELQDILHWQDERRFRLVGRSSDLVNIAGKRASLAELNGQLLALPGVVDGVIFEPPEEAGVTRLAALVVAPGCDRSALRSSLRATLDPAFIPRPLVLVDALPRNETGKLPRQQLLELYRACRG